MGIPEVSPKNAQIRDPFWSERLQINADRAIYHQWDQLEKSGCIENFRICIGEKEGFREGWVFADSDAYKWLEAASRIYAITTAPRLKILMDELIRLIGSAQTPDGYIFTFNQIHFPRQRWVNLQVEHELYCLGHLIEAAISHFEATGENSAITIANKTADLLVSRFMEDSPAGTDGHQEIEIALLRLYEVSGNHSYLDLSQHFIEQRGHIPFFGLLIQRQNNSYSARKVFVKKMREEYARVHPEYSISKIPPDNASKYPPFSKLRRKFNGWSGLYNQQHAPIRKQTVPVGHAVRYGYFQTAITMLYRLRSDKSLLLALTQSWERLVTRRMYVTGGLGSLPGNEGFGFDYELDPEYAYNETCAALASMFWNWEMALVTREAKYSDLFEWQLYNAASVGMGMSGKTYLYNNPLCVHAGITREAWYSVPCCPSNLSRTFANLAKYIYSFDEDNLWVHQYIGNETNLGQSGEGKISIDSNFPFDGNVTIKLNLQRESDFTLHLRIPSWCQSETQDIASLHNEQPLILKINDQAFPTTPPKPAAALTEQTAQGFDPRSSYFCSISRTWQPGDTITITFELPILLRKASPKVRNHARKVTVTRGPLVYCLESTDNHGLDIFDAKLDPESLTHQTEAAALGKIDIIHGKTRDGKQLVFIPYYLWANRGESQITVWVKT